MTKTKESIEEEKTIVQPAEEETSPKEETEAPAVAGTTITKQELEDLKKQYKKLFQSYYNNKFYVWHRLSRADFTRICEETENLKDDVDAMLAEREKGFCKACIVYPSAEEVAEDVDYEITREKLAQEIVYHSGFYNPITQEI